MRLEVKFNLLNERIDVIFDGIHFVGDKDPADYNYYEGEYEVTPTVAAQSLATAKKVMRKDMTINAIPYAEVTNTANGLTVTIAD